jgi:hypothetical protein
MPIGRKYMKIKLLNTDKLVSANTTRDSLGTQSRQEENIEGREELKRSIKALGLQKPIEVREWCKYSGADLPEGVEDGDGYYAVVDGHTRAQILAELAEEGVETVLYQGNEMRTTDIYALVKPSLSAVVTEKLMDVPSENFQAEFQKEMNLLISNQLEQQDALNLGVKWGDVSRSVNFHHAFKLVYATALMDTDPFGIREEGQSDKALQRAAKKVAMDRVADNTGHSTEEIRELIKLSDPDVTPIEIQEALADDLIMKSHAIDLRRIYISPQRDEDGNVTNQEAVDTADETRNKLLQEAIQGLTPTKLRQKIAQIESGGTKIKEKGRKTTTKAEPKVSGLDEATASTWIEKFETAFDSAEPEVQQNFAGAIAVLKAAIDPSSVGDIALFVMDEAEEYMEEYLEELAEQED